MTRLKRHRLFSVCLTRYFLVLNGCQGVLSKFVDLAAGLDKPDFTFREKRLEQLDQRLVRPGGADHNDNLFHWCLPVRLELEPVVNFL